MQPLQKAYELDQSKDYIPHKLAQAYLNMDDPDQALRVYETIPAHRRTPYIQTGMGKCFQKKGCYKDALALFYQASKKEPTKGYHFEHMGIALAALGDKNQAIACLTKCNSLFADEFGKVSSKILTRIEELRNLPHKQNVNLSDFDEPIPADSRGKITAYISERGFGFIEDEIDKQKVFFHIKKVKRGFEPSIGSRVRFLREEGEKGPMASRVWLSVQDSPQRGSFPFEAPTVVTPAIILADRPFSHQQDSAILKRREFCAVYVGSGPDRTPPPFPLGPAAPPSSERYVNRRLERRQLVFPGFSSFTVCSRHGRSARGLAWKLGRTTFKIFFQ